MSDDTPANQDDAFIVLATALPELMADSGKVFDQQQQNGAWGADSIEQASQRVKTLEADDAVKGSDTVSTILRTLIDNLEALSSVDSQDGERIETLRELFTMTPALTLNCNNVASDMEAVGALVTHLQDPAWPVELSEADAEKISIELLSSQTADEQDSAGSDSGDGETYPPVDEVDLTVALDEDVNPMLREAFMTEMPERVREFSDCVGQLVAGSGDEDILFTAQRAAHTIKGSAHVSGVTGMGWITHLSEDIIEHITESGDSQAPDGAYDLLQSASDCLECMVEHLQGLGPYPDDTAQVYGELRDMYRSMALAQGEEGADSNVSEIVEDKSDGIDGAGGDTDLRLSDLDSDVTSITHGGVAAEKLFDATVASNGTFASDTSVSEHTAAVDTQSDDVIDSGTHHATNSDIAAEQIDDEDSQLHMSDVTAQAADDVDAQPDLINEAVAEAVAEGDTATATASGTEQSAAESAEQSAQQCETPDDEVEEQVPLSGQDLAFVTLATALPELMTDTATVFDRQQQDGSWNADTIEQASQRVKTLAVDEAVAGSDTVATILSSLGANFDALETVDDQDSERVNTLRELFTMTPALALNCNNVAADMEAVGELVTHLQDPAWPVELSEADAEKISIELLSSQEADETDGAKIESASEETYPPVGEADLTVALAEDINPMLREAFMSEMPERVREFSDCVGQLVAGTGDDETLFAAQRAAHTIKGSAHVSGVTGMGWITHLSEDIVEHITESRSSEIPDGAYDQLQAASDCLECMVEHLQGVGPYPDETASVYSNLRDMYLSMATGADDSIESAVDSASSHDVAHAQHEDTDASVDDMASSGVDSDDATQIDADTSVEPTSTQLSDTDAEAASITVATLPEFRPSKARVLQEKQSDEMAEKSIHLNIRQLKSLQNLAGDISIHNVRMGGFSVDATQALSDLARQQMIVQQRLEDLTTLLMYQGVQSNIVKPGEEEDDFDALEMDQYTELHSATNLAYEAVIDAQEMTSNIRRQVKSFGEILSDNGRVSRDFNDEVSSIRMVTFAELSPRLQRVARQTAKATGKTVELVIEGEDVQFDRDLYNPLADALLHAIRNAIDHGIETPEERLARDKPETGTVTIRLERDAGDILISCHDDGGGLDFDAIREKAVSKNQIVAGEEPTQAELAQLIFAPGFSTRQDVSQISGRGMGMNIVFEVIRTRHGSVDIESDEVNGTTVRMRMPMSLMSMHLIIAKYGDETYAIPSNSVEQLVLSDMGEVLIRDTAEGGKENIFRMGDNEWKIFALGALLGSDPKATVLSDNNDSFPLVLLKTPQGNYAVRLRHASGSGVMVVKGFGDYIERINGILGGAILADGSVCPVLDLAELAYYRREALRASQSQGMDVFAAQKEDFVLVVDDSLSARRALVQLLDDAGFATREARDGIDAIEIMDKETPKLLITDLEMPRMNGVELVQHIRARDSDNDLPIVMITSRSTAKHKSRAMDAGVSDYVNKPWDEDKLVDLVSSYMMGKLANVA